jgi:ATP-dependent Lon protease
VLLLKSTVLYPGHVVSVQLAMKPNRRLLEDLTDPEEIIGAGVYLDPDGSYVRSNLCKTAVACRVIRQSRMRSGAVQVVLHGIRRISIRRIGSTRPYFKADVACVEESGEDSPRLRALTAEVSQLVEVLVEADERYTEELVKVVGLNLEHPSQLADLVAHMIQFSFVEKRMLLETADIPERLSLLAKSLRREIARSQVTRELHVKTKQSLDRSEREAFLREELRIIQAELNEFDPAEVEIAELEARIDSAELPPLVADAVRREVFRLNSVEIRAIEGSSIRTYVDWVLAMPWNESTEDRYDLRLARRILDNRYYGLGNARDRLLEFLAVRKLGGRSAKPVLGIMGPPGTGRTSLANTVANILNRRLVRIPVHGVHDEAEIRGQLRTYAAARPGRILDGMRQVGARNPVVLIDDFDRLEPGVGDPELALLEVFDPERSCRFHDLYLGVPVDLSDVLFVVTAKVAEELPEALWDLMHIIELSGYTEGVKMAIVRERVWPSVLEEHGLAGYGIKLTSAAVRRIIRSYTREAGVHTLKIHLETICRRVAVKVAGRGDSRISISTKNLEKYLGKPFYTVGEFAGGPWIGVATGLAWTETGGNILTIEALLMPGDGKTLVTGLLGEVMQESVRTALSYVRSHSDELGISEERLKGSDIHVHFPEGAIPKDGPSAGVAVATAIASLLSRRPVRSDVAVTGEISLRGWVLPVGGVREKVLAAYRAGIRHVVLPRGNESDLTDVPRDVLSKMHPHFVDEVVEVFRIALEKKSEKTGRRRSRSAPSV